MLSLSVFGAYFFSCAFLCSFIVLNVRDNEPVDVFRILSGAVVIVTQTLAAFSSAGNLPLEDVACSLILADAIMLMAPSRHEPRVASIVLCSVMTISFFLMPFVHMMKWGVLFPIIVIPVLLDIVLKARQKYSRVRALFRREQVGCNIIDYSSLFYCVLLMCVIALCFLDNPVLLPLSCAMSLILYIFIFKNRSRGHSVFLNGKKALVVESLLTGSLREPDLLGSSEDSHMNRLYKALIVFMKRHKPFLDSGLTLETLSSQMMTNRVYLSRTINAFSGVNYSTFINNYRIEYAKELMLRDPSIRSEEAGRASGFQAESTFSRVFKQITGETPSSYLKNIRSQASLHSRPQRTTARREPDYPQDLPEDL